MKDMMKMLLPRPRRSRAACSSCRRNWPAWRSRASPAEELVRVKLNGKMEARGVKIDPSLIKPDEAEMLEDLILAAFQDAKGKAEAAMQEKMKEVTGGLPIHRPDSSFLTAALYAHTRAPLPLRGRTERHGLSSPPSVSGLHADRRAKSDGVPGGGEACKQTPPP